MTMTGDRFDTAQQVMAAWASRSGRAVIFDFNGTLSDDETILAAIFIEIFDERLGLVLTPSEYHEQFGGLSDREIIETAVAASSPSDAAQAVVEELMSLRTERYLAAVAAKSPIATSTVALVSRLAAAAVPIAVVTGAQRAEVDYVLERSGAGQHIRAIVTEEDVVRGKPDPEGFLMGARLLDREPQDILVFEDSIPGVEAAQAAGMSCIAISAAHSPPGLHACTTTVSDRLGPWLLDSLEGMRI